jgi:hypothetical protein
MIEPSDKAPRLGPCKRLQIKETYVVEHIIILARDTAYHEELVFVENSSVSSPTFRDGARHLGLSPKGCLQVKDD